jgi:hypothetical protein
LSHSFDFAQDGEPVEPRVHRKHRELFLDTVFGHGLHGFRPGKCSWRAFFSKRAFSERNAFDHCANFVITLSLDSTGRKTRIKELLILNAEIKWPELILSQSVGRKKRLSPLFVHRDHSFLKTIVVKHIILWYFISGFVKGKLA